jgi:RHS repeat-associated protein
VIPAAHERTLAPRSVVGADLHLGARTFNLKKPHQGVSTKKSAPHQGITWSKSTTALGLPGVWLENRTRKSYRARYYSPDTGRFISEDPISFNGGTNFYQYVLNNPTQWADPYGLCPPNKSCGVKKGPAYDVAGAIPKNTTFHMHAEFLNDATHDPNCCEVRQLISWNQAISPNQSAPHAGFQPPRDKPGNWYEDRTDHNLRYGRRAGPYSALQPGNSYGPDSYDGADTPGSPQPIPGLILSFRLIVVDTCNGGKTIASGKTITVNF